MNVVSMKFCMYTQVVRLSKKNTLKKSLNSLCYFRQSSTLKKHFFVNETERKTKPVLRETVDHECVA